MTVADAISTREQVVQPYLARLRRGLECHLESAQLHQRDQALAELPWSDPTAQWITGELVGLALAVAHVYGYETGLDSDRDLERRDEERECLSRRVVLALHTENEGGSGERLNAIARRGWHTATRARRTAESAACTQPGVSS